MERPIDRSELYICDELFLTGTAVGLAPIVRVDHRPVKDGPSDQCASCKSLFRCDARDTCALPNWLTPVYQSRMTHEQELVCTVEAM